MATTYLSKDYTTNPTNGAIANFSVWVKRGNLGARNKIIGAYDGGAAGQYLEFFTNNTIRYHSGNGLNTTNAVFRDTSAWYHIVVLHNTGGSGASNQVKIWVNGNLQSLSTNSGATVNSQIGKNSVKTVIGVEESAYSSSYFDGSMSHFHFIDGTAYDATAFGEYDANGVWKIKTSPSVTYGTNGFFILKDGNSVTDQSGNSNNFTVAGGTLTNTEDNPSNVFCNFMSHTTSSYMTISNGGTTLLGNTATDSGNSLAGLGVSSGKWYFEVKITVAVNGYPILGYVKTTDSEFGHQNANGGGGDPAPRIYGFTNASTYNGSSSTSNLSFSNGDIIGFAFDLDNGAVYFSQNGTFINSSDPTSGASKTNAQVSFSPDGETYTLFCGSYNNSKAEFNFGNGYFGTTAVASAGTNASGIGIFEYDVPTGYTALSTKGLNL
jgi:hypothetical protein